MTIKDYKNTGRPHSVRDFASWQLMNADGLEDAILCDGTPLDSLPEGGGLNERE